MKGLARPGAACWPGGSTAAPGNRNEQDGWGELLDALGYLWCRPCVEWHRPPECWIDQEGRSALDIALSEDSFRS